MGAKKSMAHDGRDTSTFHHGAVFLAPGCVRFSLWAPDAEQVTLELEGQPPSQLQAQVDGWHCTDKACAPGTRYRFLINGNLHVPDPASRAQSGGVHGWSRVIDHRQYAWRSTQWQGRPWHESVIYEVHVGLLGGFTGVQARLPELAKLGITAIELMPLSEFPGARNWGYDGTLPFAPASAYGSPEDLKALIDSAHELGLMVFVDVVYNHFGPDGNYLGHYASEFFRSDITTAWGSAIDFRRPQVRDYFFQNALMWINDYRVDGLRLDAVHAISENDFLIELAERVKASISPQRHVHLVLENEDNNVALLDQGFTAQWNDDGHNVLHTLLTGESESYYADFAQQATEKLARCLSEGFIFQGQPDRRGQHRGEISTHLPPTAFVLFLQNHDQIGNRAFGERLISLAHPDALKAATALLLLSPMVPLLFMGEEWGSTRPFLYFTDHQPELGRAVREGRQKEFAEFALFGDASRQHEIPDPNAEASFTACLPDYTARNQAEHAPWTDLYRRLLRLRHQNIIPHLTASRSAGVRLLGEGALEAQWDLGYENLNNCARLSIAINLGKNPVEFTLPKTNRIIFSHRVDPNALQDNTLPAYSVAVSLAESIGEPAQNEPRENHHD